VALCAATLTAGGGSDDTQDTASGGEGGGGEGTELTVLVPIHTPTVHVLRVGVGARSSGEPVVRGIAKSVGVTEQDLDLTPVGDGTALAVRAVEDGQVDAFGGPVDDTVALEQARSSFTGGLYTQVPVRVSGTWGADFAGTDVR
jgi:hypothetical protein